MRRKPTYCQGNGWGPQSYAVEAEIRPGTTLVVETGRAHPGNWLGLPSGPVRPADVAASIRAARCRGWDPAAQGSPFVLGPAAAGEEGRDGEAPPAGG
ncbi:hypothetical protein ACEZDB_11215 [Streptacidiphilus sp. N1-3]|uniref:Uncharacterized protein n=1 Tax=Streptacidiphilus alkalitolerans TaxID=3342712 RepID=A0ABV6WYU8_9ACTN